MTAETERRLLIEALKQCYADLQRYAPNSLGSQLARDALEETQRLRVLREVVLDEVKP